MSPSGGCTCFVPKRYGIWGLELLNGNEICDPLLLVHLNYPLRQSAICVAHSSGFKFHRLIVPSIGVCGVATAICIQYYAYRS